VRDRLAEASSKGLQELLGPGSLRKELLFRLKLRGVHTATAAAQAHGMLQMQHLVINDVFQRKARDGGVVENAADDDGVVGGIVMAKNAPGAGRTPTYLRARHQSEKKFPVKIVEDGLKIVNAAARGMQALAAAYLPDEVSLRDHLAAAGVLAVTRSVPAVDGLAVHLGQEDVGDGADNRFGGAFEQIGKANQQPAPAQANGVIEIGEPEELDFQFRQGNAGAQPPMLVLKYSEKPLAHGEARLA